MYLTGVRRHLIVWKSLRLKDVLLQSSVYRCPSHNPIESTWTLVISWLLSMDTCDDRCQVQKYVYKPVKPSASLFDFFGLLSLQTLILTSFF